jgi:transcriptional regulator with XRE-family HTH domain
MKLAETRMQMGFTQQELAGCLGVSCTQVTMYEQGCRMLPYRVLSQLRRMECCLEDETELAPIKTALMAAHQLEAKKALEVHARNTHYAITRLRWKLKRLEEAYNHCLTVLAFVACARKLPMSDRKHELWLNRLEARTNCRCLSCGPEKQVMVSLRLQSLVLLHEALNKHCIF